MMNRGTVMMKERKNKKRNLEKGVIFFSISSAYISKKSLIDSLPSTLDAVRNSFLS
jgi:hypothetical protein